MIYSENLKNFSADSTVRGHRERKRKRKQVENYNPP